MPSRTTNQYRQEEAVKLKQIKPKSNVRYRVKHLERINQQKREYCEKKQRTN